MGIYFSFEDLLKNLNPEKGVGVGRPPPLVVRVNLPLGPFPFWRQALRVSITDEF